MTEIRGPRALLRGFRPDEVDVERCTPLVRFDIGNTITGGVFFSAVIQGRDIQVVLPAEGRAGRYDEPAADGCVVVEVVVDPDRLGPGPRHEQADDVAADDAEHAEVEHRAPPPQQPVLVELRRPGRPATRLPCHPG